MPCPSYRVDDGRTRRWEGTNKATGYRNHSVTDGLKTAMGIETFGRQPIAAVPTDAQYIGRNSHLLTNNATTKPQQDLAVICADTSHNFHDHFESWVTISVLLPGYTTFVSTPVISVHARQCAAVAIVPLKGADPVMDMMDFTSERQNQMIPCSVCLLLARPRCDGPQELSVLAIMVLECTDISSLRMRNAAAVI